MATYAELMTEAKSLVEAGKAGTLTAAQVARMDTIKGDIEAAKQAQDIAEGDALMAQFKGTSGPAANGAPSLAPTLNLSTEDAQGLFKAAQSRQSFQVRAKSGPIAYKTATSAITPPSSFGGIVGKAYEPVRILNYLTVAQMTGPSIDFLTHATTTGAAETVARGGLKPEVTYDWTPSTLTARKIAVQTGIPDEVIADFAQFLTYLSSDLQRLIIEKENQQILNGDGLGENLKGILNTSGLLTRAKGTDTALDAVEQAIADLRTGPAYVEPDALVIHPSTWSSIRRSKNTQGDYLISADPTNAEANSLWGLPVLATTSIAAGTALLGNLKEGVQGYVRQGLTVDVSSTGDDFIHNITRVRAEERIAVGVNRPAALVKITGL